MKPSRRRPARRGFALMLVVVTTTLVLSAWALANRRTAALLRLRQAQADRLVATLGSVSETHLSALGEEAALAYAVALMETGDPPVTTKKGKREPYYCQKTCNLTNYVVEYAPDSPTTGQWTITATPASQWTGTPALKDIPQMPSSF